MGITGCDITNTMKVDTCTQHASEAGARLGCFISPSNKGSDMVYGHDSQ